MPLAFGPVPTDVDLVTFDVFDTLVTRTVARPTDVFALMTAESEGFLPSDFPERRHSAERAARTLAAADGREEITLQSIYDVMVDRGWLAPRLAEGAMAFEIATEERVCVPRPGMPEFVAACQESGLRVVAVSDMYLPAFSVTAILERCGYGGLQGVVVSSAEGLTKHSGRLYDALAAREGVRPERWLHVGDNPWADGTRARRLGIRTLATPLPVGQEAWQRASGTLADGIYERAGMIVAGRSPAACDTSRFWQEVGTQIAAPLVIGLCHAVREKARSTGSDRIYFLARDGAVVKRAFEALFPGDRSRKVYLHASRRTVNFACMRSLDDGALRYLKGGSAPHTMAELLARIGLNDPSVLARGLAAMGLESDRTGIPSHLLDRGFMACSEEILAAAARERATFVDYLRSEGMLSGGDAVVVDVGWNCSIQRSLVGLLEAEGVATTLHGVYVGTRVNVHKGTPLIEAEGWLYERGAREKTRASLDRCVEFVELMFAAPEHGIVGIEAHGEGFRPIRWQSDEEETRIHVARYLHAAVDGVCRILVDSGLVQHSADAGATALRRLDAFLLNPTPLAVEYLGSVRHSMGFGASRYMPFVTQPSTWTRPKPVLRAMVRSFWREAFPMAAPRRLRLPARLAVSVLMPLYRRAAYLKYRIYGA